MSLHALIALIVAIAIGLLILVDALLDGPSSSIVTKMIAWIANRRPRC